MGKIKVGDTVDIDFTGRGTVKYVGFAEPWVDITLGRSGRQVTLPLASLTVVKPPLARGDVVSAEFDAEPPVGTVLRGNTSHLAYQRRSDGWVVAGRGWSPSPWDSFAGDFTVLYVGDE